MSARKKTASRGFVNNIILESLISGDKYGYEIIKMVDEKSNGKIILKQPSLYSSLKRFETKGYITSYWGDSDIGGRRHYYTITETGKNYFNKTDKKIEDSDNEETIEEETCTQETLNFNDRNDEVINIETQNISENNNEESKVEEIKGLVTELNPDSSEYNIFNILEQENKPEKPIIIKHQNVSENAIQVDMFTNKTTTSTKIDDEQVIDHNKLNEYKQSSPVINEIKTEEIQNKKQIPLIQETYDHNFFNWDEKYQESEPTAKVFSPEPKNIEKENSPIKNQIIMDEYGIIKMGGATPIKQEKKIYDNVGYRIDYKDPVIRQEKKQVKQTEKEVTPEQRERINKNFNQKFEQIINEKNSINAKENDEIDYKNILGELLADDESTEIKSNNYNYEIETDSNDDENQNYIPIKQVETAINNIEINNSIKKELFSDEGFKFKPYTTETDEKEQTNNFILINKAKINFGIFTFVLMILQISTLLIILKLNGLLISSDYTLFAIGYGIAIAFLLITIIPYFIAPDKRANNNFRFTYSLLFGILLFFAGCALTYAICTFLGLNTLNVSLFAARLLLPVILCINFILAPMIYKITLQDKKIK